MAELAGKSPYVSLVGIHLMEILMSEMGQKPTLGELVSDVCFQAESGRKTHGFQNSVCQRLLLSGERTSQRGSPNVSL